VGQGTTVVPPAPGDTEEDPPRKQLLAGVGRKEMAQETCVPWAREIKTKQKKTETPRRRVLLSLSPRRSLLPLPPISFDVAGYAGGLDAGGVVGLVIQSSAVRCSTRDPPHEQLLVRLGADGVSSVALVALVAGCPPSLLQLWKHDPPHEQ
jgi:hypothetical protein